MTWDYIRDLVDEVVTVSEDDLAEGLRGLVAEDHLIAEGAASLPWPPWRRDGSRIDSARAAVVVSGANIDNSRPVGYWRLTIDEVCDIVICTAWRTQFHSAHAVSAAPSTTAPPTHHHSFVRPSALSGHGRRLFEANSSADLTARRSWAKVDAV